MTSSSAPTLFSGGGALGSSLDAAEPHAIRRARSPSGTTRPTTDRSLCALRRLPELGPEPRRVSLGLEHDPPEWMTTEQPIRGLLNERPPLRDPEATHVQSVRLRALVGTYGVREPVSASHGGTPTQSRVSVRSELRRGVSAVLHPRGR